MFSEGNDMIQFNCSCGKAYQLPDEMGGKKVKCASCQAVMSVPASADLAPLAASGPAPMDDLFAGLPRVEQPSPASEGITPSPLATTRPQRAPTSPLVWAIAGVSGVALLLAVVVIVIMGMSEGTAPQSSSPPPGWVPQYENPPGGKAKAPP
jgi:LSD1 subclass zinc finger protein